LDLAGSLNHHPAKLADLMVGFAQVGFLHHGIVEQVLSRFGEDNRACLKHVAPADDASRRREGSMSLPTSPR